jgi:hypothetical protein
VHNYALMKQTLSLLSLIVLLAASCKNFDEGPKLSFRNSEKLLIKYRWALTKFIVDGDDHTADYGPMVLDFDKQAFVDTTIGQPYQGTWSYDSKNKKLNMIYGNGSFKIYEIKRLTKDQLIMERSDIYSYHIRAEFAAE